MIAIYDLPPRFYIGMFYYLWIFARSCVHVCITQRGYTILVYTGIWIRSGQLREGVCTNS